jgi:flagellar basal body L-ring protein FlgH
MKALNTKLFARLSFFLALCLALSGCADLMGALRPDLDDHQTADNAPTVGGRWSERGFLDESMPDGGSPGRFTNLGHSERAPASMNSRGQADEWIDPTRADQNRQDMARGDENSAENGDNGMVSFSNTPNLPPPTKRLYKNGNRATRADFIDESPNEGSLWASDGQTNYYFTKNKVRGVGDIITVSMEDGLIRDMGLEIRHTLNERERDVEMALAEDRARARTASADTSATGANGQKTDSVASSAAAPNRAPASGASANAANADAPKVMPSDVDVSKSLELKAGDTMMAEIIERYPNGNYKIRGTKRVLYKNGAPRLVNLIGVVKGSDIAEDDTVPSGKLYEYRLEAVR